MFQRPILSIFENTKPKKQRGEEERREKSRGEEFEEAEGLLYGPGIAD